MWTVPSASSTLNDGASPEADRAIAETSASVSIFTPAPRHSRTSVSTTSDERYDAGKALSPRSTTVGIPADSKKSITLCGGKLRHAGRTNCAPLRMWAANASQSFRLVKLHRPLPVIIILRPARGIFSIKQIRASSPFRAAVDAADQAAIRPEAPPPMTMMSYFIC